MTLRHRFSNLCIVILLVGSSARAQRSDSTGAKLFATIAALDSALFAAFNTCSVAAFESFLTEDLEFYHDFNGLAAPRSKTIEIITEECNAKRLGRRELVPGSLEVHPLRGYGAIEIGVHRFFVRTATGETPGSTAKFIHIWRNDAGQWRIRRVLSFDHQR